MRLVKLGGVDVDLTNCDKEAIHLIGKVQSFGCCLVFNDDWLHTDVSANVSDFIGCDASSILGKSIETFFSRYSVQEIRSSLQISLNTGVSERIFQLSLNDESEQRWDVCIHKNEFIFIEIERAIAKGINQASLTARSMIRDLPVEGDLISFLSVAVNKIRSVTNFDRVMAYRFLHDESGQVVAESRSQQVDSFLGLRFPAFDIPQQARALLKKQTIRITADVNDQGVPFISNKKNPVPLDLTYSMIRAVSSIHLEYLTNMGVQGSLTISIIVEGKLWGMFACHHRNPKYVPFDIRTLLEFFIEIFSLKLANRLLLEQYQYEKAYQSVHEELMGNIDSQQSSFDNLRQQLLVLKRVIKCDGLALWLDGQYVLEGIGQTEEELQLLIVYLNQLHPSKAIPINDFSVIIPNADSYKMRTAGCLAIPLSQSPKDYLIFYRQAAPLNVKWAGEPDKSVSVGPNGPRLTLRKSFAEWVQTHSTQCEHWHESDIYIANALRVTLLEIIFIKSFRDKEMLRKEFQQKQDTLITELNHRVRNILALMRGIVSSSDENAYDKNEFKILLDGRIRSLAFAHDQLTKHNWTSVTLIELFENEANAYVNDTSQVKIDGISVNILPTAVSCLVLVIHEMFTNAVKYGALSSPSGQVHITWYVNKQDKLQIEWRESGGPLVKTPERKGFGTTIITRSIPHELDGTSHIAYEEKGVHAVFEIPEKNYSVTVVESHLSAAEKIQTQKDSYDTEKSILILEDNIFIGMDTEKMVENLGFKDVFLCANNAEALDCIKNDNIKYAILDYNLGTETSEMVALYLLEKGTPFFFASGYGNQINVLQELQHIPVVIKPYDMAAIKTALNNL